MDTSSTTAEGNLISNLSAFDDSVSARYLTPLQACGRFAVRYTMYGMKRFRSFM